MSSTTASTIIFCVSIIVNGLISHSLSTTHPGAYLGVTIAWVIGTVFSILIIRRSE